MLLLDFVNNFAAMSGLYKYCHNGQRPSPARTIFFELDFRIPNKDFKKLLCETSAVSMNASNAPPIASERHDAT